MVHDTKTQMPQIGNGEKFYRIDLWCGSGYRTLPFWVWADCEEDAIDTLFAWCYARGVGVFDAQTAKTFDLTDDEAEEFFVTNSDGTLFARSENFSISQLVN